MKPRRMPRQQGTQLKARDLPEAVWNGDLIYFDGPVLSLHRLPEVATDAFFLLVDKDQVAERWCICEVSRTQLKDYLAGILALRNILEAAPTTMFFDLGDHGRRAVARTSWAEFPEFYRPSERSFLSEEIATETARKLAEDTVVMVDLKLSGDDLFIEDLSQIPRTYQQLYSFHYGLKHLDRAAVRERVAALMQRWTSGLSAVNLFTGLRNVIPSVHRPRVAHLHYASPGHIRLELLPEMSAEITKVVNRVANPEHERTLDALYQRCYQYFKHEKLGGFEDNDNQISDRLTPVQADEITQFVNNYFDVFGWTSYMAPFAELEASPIQQLRAVLAYHRRLRTLVRYVQKGTVSLPLPNH